ncbi:CbtB domain-containing protein [Candidatus Halocynthiibacter alkanivorans]|uniref:CbtB domain-containing protein n=1 Tax=Candidatus Halocynthiibacter alkanivorans TaxID=2267619 RepID=UPI000DF38DB5|nr:CbtB domain-containing protein [Candidatus Halocynthiibacter alkanivorans]
MTTIALGHTRTNIMPILGAALIGLTLMFAAGNLQASSLHDAAHDMRHAVGFPCH